jgi:hypothetical protein
LGDEAGKADKRSDRDDNAMQGLNPIVRLKKTGTYIVRTGKETKRSGYTLIEWRHVDTMEEADRLLGTGKQLELFGA